MLFSGIFKEFKLKPSCIYRDDNKKLMIIAADSSDAALENLLKSGNIRFNDVRNDNDIADFLKRMYTRRIVHDVDAFREKILLSENHCDDRVIELMKLALSGLMKREHSEPVYRVFLEDLTHNFMEFTVITGKRAPFEYVTVNTPLDSYNSFQKRYQQKLGRSEDDEYIETDQRWAAKAGLLDDDDLNLLIPTD